MSYLILKENEKMFWKLPDGPDGFTIGRIADNDLAILDPQVSRHHARLEAEGGGWKLTDLGSANGTFVNGEKIETSPLKFGDEIRFGKTSFRLSEEAPLTDEDTD